MDILVSWIGNSDLLAAECDDLKNIGPIAQALASHSYGKVVFLDNYQNNRTQNFLQWLNNRFDVEIEINHINLTSPTNHKEIYASARNLMDRLYHAHPNELFTFHLSPGTPAMSLVWMLLAPRYGARLIESSIQNGVQTVIPPFEISAYFLLDREIINLANAEVPSLPAFRDILHKSETMMHVVQQASYMAPRDVTILIEGESGTGKELFARAIHDASKRSKGPFVPVNCGAIPVELFESQLFGHAKGAFTNAITKSHGYFGEAEGGTLFLDEIGELSLMGQVKLLRALQEKVIVPVGESREKKVNVRVVAATNRNLLSEVVKGNFRSDLFYRIAIGIVRLPALRERGEDLEMLIDAFLDEANREFNEGSEFQYKRFSDSAKKIMINYSWPGNVRELKNTVIRAALWTRGELIDADTTRRSLFTYEGQHEGCLDHSLGNGFKLDDLLAQVERRYLKRAMDESHGVIAKATGLLGLNNYQTLTNRLKKYGMN